MEELAGVNGKLKRETSLETGVYYICSAPGPAALPPWNLVRTGNVQKCIWESQDGTNLWP